jgi:hypothetical protein
MACGVALVFELTEDAVYALPDTETAAEARADGDPCTLIEAGQQVVDNALRKAYLRLIRSRFDPDATVKTNSLSKVVVATTPAGVGEFALSHWKASEMKRTRQGHSASASSAGTTPPSGSTGAKGTAAHTCRSG